MNLKIATRKSKLAQIQAERVIDLIRDKLGRTAEKVLIVTEGDKRLDVTLDKIGGKGLFVKEIEKAILEGKADAAVHSMKDVPSELPEGFILAAITDREDVRDAFISREGISFFNLRKGAIIGTSSIRRATQLKALREDIKIVPIRGNVQTRLEKMKNENMDGIVLAVAGLKRLGLTNLITDYFEPELFVPAIGQGALGIECLKDSNNIEYFKALDNEEARICVEAERNFMKALNGDCHSFIGGYAKISEDNIKMIGTYMVNGKIIKKAIISKREDYKLIGAKLANMILTEENNYE